MGVDLSIADLVHVEPILVGLNTVDVNVVDTILCRTCSVCRSDLILQVLLCAPERIRLHCLACDDFQYMQRDSNQAITKSLILRTRERGGEGGCTRNRKAVLQFLFLTFFHLRKLIKNKI